MPHPHVIQGEPGQRWLNDTGALGWQLRVAGWHTCAFCWSLDGRISLRGWAIPFHPHCRCRQDVIKPGGRAPGPFVDYGARILKLPVADQNAVMGRSLWRLWRHGVIDLADVIGPAGVRTLESVVASLHIPLRTLIAVGITEAIARRAHEAARRLPSDAEGRRQDAILARATGLDGLHRPTLDHLAAAASSPRLGGLPDAGIVADRERAAADLAGLLLLPLHRREKRLTDAERKIILAALGPEAARSAGAFLATIRAILAAGRPVSDALLALYRRLIK